jgi:phosphate:Na+ symporter
MDEVLPLLLGGLGLFLYSIFKLSENLNQLFSDRARKLIAKYTSYTWLSLLLGIILTILLQSSSALIIMLIILINSKVLTFRNSMGFILGANIGTTFSSKLIALDISQYSYVLLLLGLVLMLVVRSQKMKGIAAAIMYFGMLFFGLYIIEESVVPFRNSDMFTNWVTGIENNAFKGAMVGGLITLIIQSSSATVGMAIILGKQNLISITGGLAIMLGAELGTCSDTLIATIRGSRQAIKAGIFHLTYSLTTILIALLLFVPFVNLVDVLSSSQDIGAQIANGHVIFNVLAALIALPFLNIIAKVFNKILPDKHIEEEKSLRIL